MAIHKQSTLCFPSYATNTFIKYRMHLYKAKWLIQCGSPVVDRKRPYNNLIILRTMNFGRVKITKAMYF